MVASLLKVLHNGIQDERLTGKIQPNIIPFLYVHIKTGRFTKQWHRIDFNQRANFGATVSATLPVKGELLTRLYLVSVLPDIGTIQNQVRALVGSNFAGPNFGWTNSIGHALVEQCSVEIGGSRVEQLDSRLLEVLDEYNTPLEKVNSVNSMIHRVPNGFSSSSIGNQSGPTTVITPLPFWFSNGDVGAALPIDALYVDPVRVTVSLRGLGGCYYSEARNSALEALQGLDNGGEGGGGGGGGDFSYNSNCFETFPIQNSPFYQMDPSGTLVVDIAKPLLDTMPYFNGCGSTYRWPAYEKKYNRTDPSGVRVSKINGYKMPGKIELDDCYLLAEYVYLDKNEANRFRIGELTTTIVQHYVVQPVDSQGFKMVNIPLQIPNPMRNIYFFGQRPEAAAVNAHFLASRDISGSDSVYVPWWPDARGSIEYTYEALRPGFANRNSEPFDAIQLVYDGNFVKVSTENCALYRSIVPSLEMTKSPWINGYYYCIPIGLQQRFYPPSLPLGETNMNKIQTAELRLRLRNLDFPEVTPPRMTVYAWAETYNILKIYGGRGALLFGY